MIARPRPMWLANKLEPRPIHYDGVAGAHSLTSMLRANLELKAEHKAEHEVGNTGNDPMTGLVVADFMYLRGPPDRAHLFAKHRHLPALPV